MKSALTPAATNNSFAVCLETNCGEQTAAPHQTILNMRQAVVRAKGSLYELYKLAFGLQMKRELLDGCVLWAEVVGLVIIPSINKSIA